MQKFIYYHLIALILNLLSSSIAEGQKTPREEVGEALPKYPPRIKEFPINPTDEQIIKFARTLGYLNEVRKYPEYKTEAGKYYDEIQLILLNTPGHAEAFERAYQKAKNKVISGNLYWGDVDWATRNFKNLKYLPSPETMKMLFRMIEDTKGSTVEDRFPHQSENSTQFAASAAEWAIVALHEIGIENPPDSNARSNAHILEYALNYRPAWQTWWQEVKDGKRTYKFKGSDVVYDYDGPVKIFRKEESSTMPSERKPVSSDRAIKREEPITEKKPVSSPLIWTVAAVGALLIGVWRLFVVKKRQVR